MLWDINIIPNEQDNGYLMLPPGVLHMSALGRFGRFTLFSPRVSHSKHLPCSFCFVLCFGFGVFVALLCFCFLFCKCFGIPNSPRSLDLDDRQGLIASSAMQQKKTKTSGTVVYLMTWRAASTLFLSRSQERIARSRRDMFLHMEWTTLTPQTTLPRLFFDLFARHSAPLSAAAKTANIDHFHPFDIEFNHVCDILNDDQFETLFKLAHSGLIGAIWSAPPCRLYPSLIT